MPDSRRDLSDSSDEDLARLMAESDERQAWAVLWDRYSDPLRRRLRRRYLLGDADLDDVVLTVFLRVWECRHRYDPGRPFAPWITRLALNQAFDLLRRNRRRDAFSSLSEDPVDHRWSHQRAIDRIDWEDTLATARAELQDDRERAVFEEMIAGATTREIAEKLSALPESTGLHISQSTASRIAAKLRRRLEELWSGDRSERADRP